MNQFEIQFNLGGRLHSALVTEMVGTEANQYSIVPQEETILRRFGTQIIHVYHVGHRNIAFPVKHVEQQAFWGVVGSCLRQTLRLP